MYAVIRHSKVGIRKDKRDDPHSTFEKVYMITTVRFNSPFCTLTLPDGKIKNVRYWQVVEIKEGKPDVHTAN